jgi:hypothetical protein
VSYEGRQRKTRRLWAVTNVVASRQQILFGEEEDESVTQVASMAGDTSADNEAGGHGETLAPNPYVFSNAEGPLDRDELVAIDAWWRAANYLAVGQIYLSANPLLREPRQPKRIKPRPLGHFGSVPGLNLVFWMMHQPSAMTRLAWRAGDRRGSGRCETRR